MLKDGAGNDRLVRTVLEYGQEFQFLGESRAFYSSSDIESGFMINKYMDPLSMKMQPIRGISIQTETGRRYVLISRLSVLQKCYFSVRKLI